MSVATRSFRRSPRGKRGSKPLGLCSPPFYELDTANQSRPELLSCGNTSLSDAERSRATGRRMG